MTRALRVFLIVLSAGTFTIGEAQTDVTKEVVGVASDVITVVVSQPTCPLKIDEAYVVRRSDGKYAFVYRVQNTGKKAIKDFSLARLYSNNTGFVGQGDMKGSLRTGDFAGSYIFLNSHERKILKNPPNPKTPLQPPVIRIAFFMITEIWFTDGSRFDETERFRALEKHLELFEPSYDKSHANTIRNFDYLVTKRSGISNRIY
jgi:hypothetical protein